MLTGARLAIIILALPTASAFAGSKYSINYENFYRDPELGRARIILKVENNSERTIGMMSIECAFLDKNDKALDTATLIASNIRPGEPAYVDGWSAQITGIEHAQCRVSRASPVGR